MKRYTRIMDLCLSCKACKSECPSNVDMTKLKAEFLQHYYEIHGIPFRTLACWLASEAIRLGNALQAGCQFSDRNQDFQEDYWFCPRTEAYLKFPKSPFAAGGLKILLRNTNNGTVYLFADEFTNYNESDIGIKVILLLEKLGYKVVIPKHIESGRTFLSKGLLKRAARRGKQEYITS